jgi:hypothetical protein
MTKRQAKAKWTCPTAKHISYTKMRYYGAKLNIVALESISATKDIERTKEDFYLDFPELRCSNLHWTNKKGRN